jgi:hypothetical protein
LLHSALPSYAHWSFINSQITHLQFCNSIPEPVGYPLGNHHHSAITRNSQPHHHKPMAAITILQNPQITKQPTLQQIQTISHTHSTVLNSPISPQSHHQAMMPICSNHREPKPQAAAPLTPHLQSLPLLPPSPTPQAKPPAFEPKLTAAASQGRAQPLTYPDSLAPPSSSLAIATLPVHHTRRRSTQLLQGKRAAQE